MSAGRWNTRIVSAVACSSSAVRTMQHQEELPPLPVPELKDSCDLYLRSLRPLVHSEEQYETAKRKVDAFCTGRVP